MATVRILVAREHGRRSIEYARAVGRSRVVQVVPGDAHPIRRIPVGIWVPRHLLPMSGGNLNRR